MTTHGKRYEKHAGKIGGSIKDIIYAANDGIITTFAVAAGVTGAALESKTIIILGLSNLLADGFSMAASNYLGSRSERELVENEYRREIKEIDQVPEEELGEVSSILKQKGYSAEHARTLSVLLRENKPFFADFMLRYELGLNPRPDNEFLFSLLTFSAFSFSGFLPLLPFLFFPSSSGMFSASLYATGISLFIVGALRKLVTGRSWFISGIEMLFVGGVAAFVAYGMGFLISKIL